MSTSRYRPLVAFVGAAIVCTARASFVQAAPAADSNTLAASALALLQERCSECHDDLARSGLNVLERAAFLKGGDHGVAVVVGHPEQSPLMKMVRHEVKTIMPPAEKKLSDKDIDILRRWIEAGVPFPQAAAALPGVAVKKDEPKWWSFRAVVAGAPPQPKDPDRWIKNPIDAFVLATLQAQGLTPSPTADRPTLIRRATFDLHGLAPTQAEIDLFVADKDPNAYDRLVDRLLASPHYGEKWGRYWLDLARYGDSSGYEQDPYLLDAWRYRDYVINSLNSDKPFDRFIKEQIAGDEFWPDDPEAQRGTGLYTVGANRDMLFKVEDTNRVETLTDFVDTTGALFMGLSVGCARCHDHKFDPISQKDYFRLQAVFVPAVKQRVFLDYNASRTWDISENYRQFKLRGIGEQLAALFAPYNKKIEAAKRAKLPQDVQAAFAVEEGKRTAEQKSTVAAHMNEVRPGYDETKAIFSKADKARLLAIEKQLVQMYTGFGPPPMAPGITDAGPVAPVAFMPSRGGGAPTPVNPGFLGALGGGEIAAPPPTANSTGRRKALAEWLTRPSHPLTWRVIVNRLWTGHFVRGIVSTPSDFGRRGTPPSHPALLDWLATEFVKQGYSLKAMHRLMMTSHAYQLSSVGNAEALAKDPENLALSHMNRRRLTAEEIRDAVLQAAGSLNLKMGGPPVVPPLPKEELFGLSVPLNDAWVVSADPQEHLRRSVYLIRKRGFQQPLFEVFDSPEGVLHCPRRETSTMAPQSLSLLNGEFAVQQAAVFAKRVTANVERHASKEESINKAFSFALGRLPSTDERALAASFLEKQKRIFKKDELALAELGRALFNFNAFLYVD
ncbi:MAG: PSD1 and planctomycete cytochrome C domain-containing protein [Deltaproteobacteria bacterium]|nr:PSD1 and planctomycete cytochrome C domain-containing protein [Deltaproteobacteria bacterium]